MVNKTPKSKPRIFKCYGCSAEIRFDKNVLSQSGKHIPLNLDGTKHDCPNSPYNRNKNAKAVGVA